MNLPWVNVFLILVHIAIGQKTSEVALFTSIIDMEYKNTQTLLDVRCLASGRYRYSPIALNIPSIDGVKILTEPLQNNNASSLNCDFETSQCNFISLRTWALQNSYHEISDERWEDLPTISTNLNFEYSDTFKPPTKKFTFSVLGTNPIKIFVGSDIYFRIEMEPEEAFINLVWESNQDEIVFVQENDILRADKWKTYTVTYEKSDNAHIITIDDVTLKKMLIRRRFLSRPSFPDDFNFVSLTTSSDKKMKWKFHKKSSIQTNNPSTIRTRNFPRRESGFCLTLYVLLCEECILKINFISGSRIVYEVQILSSQESWQREIVYCEKPGVTQISYVTLIEGSQAANTLWGIEDIKECSDEDRKIISSTISIARGSEDQVKNINCQIIDGSTPDISVRKAKNITQVEICGTGKVGPNCKYDCDSILNPSFPNTRCEHTLICNINKCFCAPNNAGPYCAINKGPISIPPPVVITPSQSSEGCKLPRKPVNGDYTVHSMNNLVVNNIAPKWTVLDFTCADPLYQLESDTLVVCDGVKWSTPIPRCLLVCPPLVERTLDIACERNEKPVDCTKEMLEDTIAFVSCKPAYELQRKPYAATKCFRGDWDKALFTCEPVCGLKPSKFVPLVIDGYKAFPGEFPWHVGIYRKNITNSQICGGTLIAADVVISAAHCFWDEPLFTILPAQNFSVASGKFYRDWSHTKDVFAQYNQIENLVTPPRFQGIINSYDFDIAIIILKKAFRLSQIVHPICVDWTNTLHEEHFMNGSLGVVAGWGLTKEGGTSANELKATNLPILDYDTCRDKSPASFHSALTHDKVCAGFGNGTNVCEGDSGGGLIFVKNDRYYLQAIVSVSPNKDNTCDAKAFTAFTTIRDNLEWIQRTEIIYRRSYVPQVTCETANGRNCIDPDLE